MFQDRNKVLWYRRGKNRGYRKNVRFPLKLPLQMASIVISFQGTSHGIEKRRNLSFLTPHTFLTDLMKALASCLFYRTRSRLMTINNSPHRRSWSSQVHQPQPATKMASCRTRQRGRIQSCTSLRHSVLKKGR